MMSHVENLRSNYKQDFENFTVFLECYKIRKVH